MNKKQVEIFMEQFEDPTVVYDEFESCIIGTCDRYGQPTIVAYDYWKCVAVLEKRDGMTHHEAREHMDFNVMGGFLGDTTPCFIERGEDQVC